MELTRRRHRRRRPLWRPLVIAFAVLVMIFLVAPLFIVVPISFSSARYLTFPPPGLSLQWYERYLDDYAWISATFVSLKVGAGATLLSTILGTLVAFGVVRGRFPGRAVVERLVAAPIIVPNIIIAVAIYGVFSQLQLIGEWPGIMLAHTVIAIPFVSLVVSAGLRTVDPAQELAAMGLGASRLTAIRRITLPQIRPAIVSAAFLAFITSFDELVLAMFISGANMTLPKKMFDNIIFEIDPTIAAVSVLQIALVAVVLLIASRFGAGAAPVQDR